MCQQIVYVREGLGLVALSLRSLLWYMERQRDVSLEREVVAVVGSFN